MSNSGPFENSMNLVFEGKFQSFDRWMFGQFSSFLDNFSQSFEQRDIK